MITINGINYELSYGERYKWDMIPSQCEYDGKIYRILNIDMQGGYFTLQDLEAKKGDVQVIEVDMLDCNLV